VKVNVGEPVPTFETTTAPPGLTGFVTAAMAESPVPTWFTCSGMALALASAPCHQVEKFERRKASWIRTSEPTR
jgi:hypothetical protein